MGTRLRLQQDLVIEHCCACSIAFAMPAEFQARAKAKPGANGMLFYCPAGHSQYYTGESEADRLRRENNRLKQNQAYLEDQRRLATEDAEHQRRRANGYKGHAARISKRAKAGICPCCNRSFENLRRHMEGQHPEFGSEAIEREVEGALT